jgi:hypothetical protein
MNVFTRTAILVAGLSLIASFGCSKAEESESGAHKPAESKSEATATNTQGLAQETLLVLKFHHDK